MAKESDVRSQPMTFRLIAAASGHAGGLDSSCRQGLFDILETVASTRQLDYALEERFGPRVVFGLKRAVLVLAGQPDSPVVQTFPGPVVERAVRWARTDLERITEKVHQLEEEDRRRQRMMALDIHKQSQSPWSHSVNGEGFKKGPGSSSGESHLPRIVKRHKSRRVH